MRFFLVAAIWLVLVGGLALYSYQRDRQLPPPVPAEQLRTAPADAYTLEITPTFTTSADPFALQGDPAGSATLIVRVADRVLYLSDKPLAAGVTRSVHPVPGLTEGNNEIHLRAVPPHGAVQDHAVRVRLLQGGRVLVDHTVWGEKGALVTGAIPFQLKGAAEGNHHER